jgi:4-amino-4-deoxy-L-arabinose transferase-like glycosyltransferase
LGQFGLIGADEPRYAQVAREMLERHDWITPVLGGHAWLEKPPLYYWQAMLAYSVFGVSDVAARMPAAVDATLLVVAVYLFFAAFRRGVEVDAALITASCAGVIGYAHAASMDMALAATFSIGMLGWWGWRESGKRMLSCAVLRLFMALGMLAKGPVAPFLAAAVIVLYALATREFRVVVKRCGCRAFFFSVRLLCPGTSRCSCEIRNSFAVFILQHNLARFSSDLYHHRQPFWYYLPGHFALALVPWTVFVIAAFVESVRLVGGAQVGFGRA